MIGTHDSVLVVDFGSQTTQLIARRVREAGVYCEIHPWSKLDQALTSLAPKAIILSGGPASVYAEGAPRIDPALFQRGLPILGICYGAQLTAFVLGGHVEPSTQREFGAAQVRISDNRGIFARLARDRETPVWMSHGDRISALPPGFTNIGHNPSTPACAIADHQRRIYGLQFHPEVTHTQRGRAILEAFLFDVAGLDPSWSAASFVTSAIERIRNTVAADEHVILGLSGGVDSSVAAVLCQRALGDRLSCIFVDNGLLRHHEAQQVVNMFRGKFGLQLVAVDAGKTFLDKLAGVTDPEQKRKIIGATFIDVFEAEANRIEGARWLVQGTLYPDVIESVPIFGSSAVIKSHHNVGGLPERMNLKLIEPLRELFKDEVREAGKALDMPADMLGRHPFPGPGLAVRCLGEITPQRLAVLRAADHIFIEELHNSGEYDNVWQAFCVLLPVRSVGVMGDERTYEEAAVVRAVCSSDGMTADWSRLPYELLARVSNRIINEVRGINRVAYDISSKPPATIEWE